MTATFENETRGAPAAARRLDDAVLQSAEEAVLANPASAAVLPGQGTPQPTLARRVAQQPFGAALLAFGAGALAAAVLRSVVNRRKHRAGRKT